MITITQVQLTNNIATVTTAIPHGIPVSINGGPVVVGVQGLITNILNGLWVLSAVTANTLSYHLPSEDIPFGPDTGMVILYTGENLRPSAMVSATSMPPDARLLIDDPSKPGSEGISLDVLRGVLLGTSAEPFRSLDVQPTGEVVKSSPGQITAWVLSNRSTSEARYFKLYNKDIAPTEEDTPVSTILLPVGLATGMVSFASPLKFLVGIGIRATTGLDDSDTGAPDTNDVVVNIYYGDLPS